MRSRLRVDTLFRSHVRALTPSRPWQYATYALTLIPINKSDTQVYVIRDPIGTRFGGAAFHIGHNITCQSKVTIVCVLISLPDEPFPLLCDPLAVRQLSTCSSCQVVRVFNYFSSAPSFGLRFLWNFAEPERLPRGFRRVFYIGERAPVSNLRWFSCVILETVQSELTLDKGVLIIEHGCHVCFSRT